MRIPWPSGAGLLRMLAFGAVFGSLFDGFHSHSETISYPHPIIWRMAWWTPFLFAGAYTLLGLGYAIANGREGRFRPLRHDVIGTLCFAGLYFLSGYLPATNAIKLAVLLTGALLLWLLLDRRPGTIVLGLVAAVLGPTTEVILVHLGAFAHLQPDLAGIPMWLPALYLASAPGVASFVAWLGYGSVTRSAGR